MKKIDTFLAVGRDAVFVCFVVTIIATSASKYGCAVSLEYVLACDYELSCLCSLLAKQSDIYCVTTV